MISFLIASVLSFSSFLSFKLFSFPLSCLFSFLPFSLYFCNSFFFPSRFYLDKMAHFLSLPLPCTVIGWLGPSRDAVSWGAALLLSQRSCRYLLWGSTLHFAIDVPCRASDTLWSASFRRVTQTFRFGFTRPQIFSMSVSWASECHQLQQGCTEPSGLVTLPSSACNQLTLSSNEIPPHTHPALPLLCFSQNILPIATTTSHQ